MKFRLLALAALLSPALAMAGEFTFTPFGSYQDYPDKLQDIYPTQGLANHGGYGAALGYRFTPNISVEINGNHNDTTVKTPDLKATNNIFSLDGMYRFHWNVFEPYLLVGAGEYQLRPKGLQNVNSLSIDAGLGTYIRINDYIALRGDWRAEHEWDNHYTQGLFELGIDFETGNFGGNRPIPVAETPPAPPPPPPPVAETPPPPPPAAPLDSDGDGVPDDLDKCPNTPHGALVDADGCPIMLKEAISKELHILFDTNKAVIKPEYKSEVEEIAKLATQYPSAFIEIQGHTDSTGGKKLNQKLSQARADAVRSSLIQDFGIASDRITAKGYGSSMPVESNKTAEGKAKNRRVMAIISGEREHMKMKHKHSE